MADKSPSRTDTLRAQGRDARLKAALKANLARRKAQARARAADSASDATPKTDNNKE
jgi:hypothetical protein